jgi:hypothetical protein
MLDELRTWLIAAIADVTRDMFTAHLGRGGL